mmetsp:Transcript_39408/g.103164  ORF Transcript_39408/g.103164 Transcript_39408/m.103164 type:complete len:368 (+) Transcript_39408:3-1106(+)
MPIFGCDEKRWLAMPKANNTQDTASGATSSLAFRQMGPRPTHPSIIHLLTLQSTGAPSTSHAKRQRKWHCWALKVSGNGALVDLLESPPKYCSCRANLFLWGNLRVSAILNTFKSNAYCFNGSHQTRQSECCACKDRRIQPSQKQQHEPHPRQTLTKTIHPCPSVWLVLTDVENLAFRQILHKLANNSTICWDNQQARRQKRSLNAAQFGDKTLSVQHKFISICTVPQPEKILVVSLDPDSQHRHKAVQATNMLVFQPLAWNREPACQCVVAAVIRLLVLGDPICLVEKKSRFGGCPENTMEKHSTDECQSQSNPKVGLHTGNEVVRGPRAVPETSSLEASPERHSSGEYRDFHQESKDELGSAGHK